MQEQLINVDTVLHFYHVICHVGHLSCDLSCGTIQMSTSCSRNETNKSNYDCLIFNTITAYTYSIVLMCLSTVVLLQLYI